MQDCARQVNPLVAPGGRGERGFAMAILLLTVSVSAAWSTQTTILPTARGALAMAVYKAIPAKFGEVHPRYRTPGFATLVMGATAIGFYLVLSLISVNALADSIASLGLAVAFYYGITASRSWCWRTGASPPWAPTGSCSTAARCTASWPSINSWSERPAHQ